MLGTLNSFRYSKRAYRRQQPKIHRLSQQKSVRRSNAGRKLRSRIPNYHTRRTSRVKHEIQTTISGTIKMQQNHNRKKKDSENKVRTKRTTDRRIEHSRTNTT